MVSGNRSFSDHGLLVKAANFNIARYQAYPFDRLNCIKKAGVKIFQARKSK